MNEQNYSDEGGDYYIIKDATIGIEPRRMLITSKGIVEDNKIEDPSDPAYIFARRFNEHYDIIARTYPCFRRIKQVAKALAFVEWLMTKKIPVDIQQINSFFQRQLLYISNSKQIIFNNSVSLPKIKRPIHMRNLSLSPTPSFLSKPQSPKYDSGFNSPTNNSFLHSLNTTMVKFSKMDKLTTLETSQNFDTKRKSMYFAKKSEHQYYIFSGVFLNFVRETLENKIMSKGVKALTSNGIFHEMFHEGEEKKPREELKPFTTFKIPFPFQKATCHVCHRYLRYSEIVCPVGDFFYCRLHHPNSCGYCFKILQGNFLSIENEKYHYECIRCRQCDKHIQGRLIKAKEGFIHMKCCEKYIIKLCQNNKLDEMFEVN